MVIKMAYCGKCGKEILDGSSFCVKCGTHFTNDEVLPSNEITKKSILINKMKQKHVLLFLSSAILGICGTALAIYLYNDNTVGAVLEIWLSQGEFLKVGIIRFLREYGEAIVWIIFGIAVVLLTMGLFLKKKGSSMKAKP